MINLKTMNKKKDTFSYKGWLNSDSFIKRMLAIMGYYITGQLLLATIFFMIWIIVAFLIIIESLIF